MRHLTNISATYLRYYHLEEGRKLTHVLDREHRVQHFPLFSVVVACAADKNYESYRVNFAPVVESNPGPKTSILPLRRKQIRIH